MLCARTSKREKSNYIRYSFSQQDKERNAGFRISHLARRTFFQFFFFHEKRKVFLKDFPPRMWQGKRFFWISLLTWKKIRKKSNFIYENEQNQWFFVKRKEILFPLLTAWKKLFQFPFPHEGRRIFLGDFPSRMWEGKRLSSYFPSQRSPCWIIQFDIFFFSGCVIVSHAIRDYMLRLRSRSWSWSLCLCLALIDWLIYSFAVLAPDMPAPCGSIYWCLYRKTLREKKTHIFRPSSIAFRGSFEALSTHINLMSFFTRYSVKEDIPAKRRIRWNVEFIRIFKKPPFSFQSWITLSFSPL